MMLRDPIGDGDVKMDDRVGDSSRTRNRSCGSERVVANNNLELLSTREKLLLEKMRDE